MEALRTIVPDAEPYQGNKALSPGMFKRHYSPKARLILAHGNGKAEAESVKYVASGFIMQGYSVGILAKEENRNRCI